MTIEIRRHPFAHEMVHSIVQAYVTDGCPEPSDAVLTLVARRLHSATPWAGTPISFDNMPKRHQMQMRDTAYAVLAGAKIASQTGEGA